MKLRILIIIAAGLVFFSSCTKEEIDPYLDIYVTTKSSENWDTANINAGNIRFAIISETGSQGWGSPQNGYLGSRYVADLTREQTNLISSGDHFDIERLAGMKLNLVNLALQNGNQEDLVVGCPKYDYVALDQMAKIENGKRYDIEFIFDFDKLVTEENGELIFNPSYEVVITEQ